MLVFVGPDAGAWGRGLLHHLRWLCNSLPRRHEQVGHFLPGLTGWWLWSFCFSFPVAALRTKKKERKTRCMVLIFDMCVCVLKGSDGCDVVSSPWQREKRRNLGSLLGGPDGRDSRLSRVHQQVSKTAALISQHALRLCRDNGAKCKATPVKFSLVWFCAVVVCFTELEAFVIEASTMSVHFVITLDYQSLSVLYSGSWGGAAADPSLSQTNIH